MARDGGPMSTDWSHDAELDARWRRFADDDVPDPFEADLAEPANRLMAGALTIAILVRVTGFVITYGILAPTLGPVALIAVAHLSTDWVWVLDCAVFAAAVLAGAALAIIIRPERRCLSGLTHWLATVAAVDSYLYAASAVLLALIAFFGSHPSVAAGVVAGFLTLIAGANVILAEMCRAIARRTRHARHGRNIDTATPSF